MSAAEEPFIRDTTGRSLVMRLMVDDIVRLCLDNGTQLMRVVKISGNGQVFLAGHSEANCDARYREKRFRYVSKMAGSLKAVSARYVAVSPIGEVTFPR
jgi:CRISPR-associated endonuclease Csn1